jgi:hypothetical protein
MLTSESRPAFSNEVSGLVSSPSSAKIARVVRVYGSITSTGDQTPMRDVDLGKVERLFGA